MKKNTILIIFLFIQMIGFSQTNIYKFNPKICFERPDTSVWILNNDKLPDEKTKGSLSFLHKPIIDSLGRSIRPMIAIIYENIKDSIDVIAYSADYWFNNNPFHVKYNLLGGFPDYSSDKCSVIFDGIYFREGVKHNVLVGFILHKKVGLQIICDSVDSIFSQVVIDMKKFEKSIYIED